MKILTALITAAIALTSCLPVAAKKPDSIVFVLDQATETVEAHEFVDVEGSLSYCDGKATYSEDYTGLKIAVVMPNVDQPLCIPYTLKEGDTTEKLDVACYELAQRTGNDVLQAECLARYSDMD